MLLLFLRYCRHIDQLCYATGRHILGDITIQHGFDQLKGFLPQCPCFETFLQYPPDIGLILARGREEVGDTLLNIGQHFYVITRRVKLVIETRELCGERVTNIVSF